MGKRKTIITPHASYWFDSREDLDNQNDDRQTINHNNSFDSGLLKITRLAQIRRAVSNLVSIQTGRQIPVMFEGEDSFTDGKRVVISADDNPDNVDAIAGLALHEAGHIVHSKFDWIGAIARYIEALKAWGQLRQAGPSIDIAETDGAGNLTYTTKWIEPANGRMFFATILLPQIIKRLVEKYGPLELNISKLVFSLQDIKKICNILEDRRIDQLDYAKSVGYRPYYNALYEKFFLNKTASAYIRLDPNARRPTIENYLNHMIYVIHPDSDPDALPGLREIFAAMDLENLQALSPEFDSPPDYSSFVYEMTPRIWQKANDIYLMILNYIELDNADYNLLNPTNNSASAGAIPPSEKGVVADSTEGEDGGEEQAPEQRKSDFRGRPPQHPRNKREKANPTAIGRQNETVNALLEGVVHKKRITKEAAASVRAFEKAKAEMTGVEYGRIRNVKCMVTRDISVELMRENWFPFGYLSSTSLDLLLYLPSYIQDGRRMGQLLLQRLQVRNDPQVTKTSRQSNGKIDRRLLANLGHGGSDVFYRLQVDKHRPAMLNVSIDASGSMTGCKFERAMAVATAIAYLTSKMQNVDSVITLRGGVSMPIVSVIFDSRRDTFQKWMKFAPHFIAGGNTPEGLAFAAIMDLSLEARHTHDLYFINISDGLPGFSIPSDAKLTSNRSGYSPNDVLYSGTEARTHTRKMVNQMIDAGVKVLSYYISKSGTPFESEKKSFVQMYGDGAEFIDITNSNMILKTLNKLLVAR
jgi:hypothetical protein